MFVSIHACKGVDRRRGGVGGGGEEMLFWATCLLVEFFVFLFQRLSLSKNSIISHRRKVFRTLKGRGFIRRQRRKATARVVSKKKRFKRIVPPDLKFAIALLQKNIDDA